MTINASQCQCGMPVSPCARCVGQKYIEAETIWLIYMCVELYRVPMKLQVRAGAVLPLLLTPFSFIKTWRIPKTGNGSKT